MEPIIHGFRHVGDHETRVDAPAQECAEGHFADQPHFYGLGKDFLEFAHEVGFRLSTFRPEIEIPVFPD